MMPTNFLSIFLIVISIVLFYYLKLLQIFEHHTVNKDRETVIVVGILSAHENFKQRELARSTWMKEFSSDERIKMFFILGNETCLIPKGQRVDPYTCELNTLNSSTSVKGPYRLFDTISTSYEISCSKHDPCDLVPEAVFHIGFSFKINHPLVITDLGVLKDFLTPDGSGTIVSLMDVQYREIVTQARIILHESKVFDGFAFTSVEKILLPKNFEGLVLIEGGSTGRSCTNVRWNDGNRAVHFKRIYITNEHLDSIKFDQHNFSAVSIKMEWPEDPESLRQSELILERQQKNEDLEYAKLIEFSERVKKEVQMNNDIVLVDVVDTYRSLPVKLLKFYTWLHAHHKFKYVMKMDDDTMVNIPQLLGKLQSETAFDPSRRPWLWGWFRKDWPVNYVGKWTDYDYPGSYYPMFPCGAAYVMSNTTTMWLVSNAEHLHMYQGEDVSMGIWLSAILPTLIKDHNFECGEQCIPESYNRAQLTVEEIPQAWSNFKKCKNFCHSKC